MWDGSLEFGLGAGVVNISSLSILLIWICISILGWGAWAATWIPYLSNRCSISPEGLKFFSDGKMVESFIREGVIYLGIDGNYGLRELPRRRSANSLPRLVVISRSGRWVSPPLLMDRKQVRIVDDEMGRL